MLLFCIDQKKKNAHTQKPATRRRANSVDLFFLLSCALPMNKKKLISHFPVVLLLLLVGSFFTLLLLGDFLNDTLDGLLLGGGSSGGGSSSGFGAAGAAVLGLVGAAGGGSRRPEEVNYHCADDGCSSETDRIVVSDRAARHCCFYERVVKRVNEGV